MQKNRVLIIGCNSFSGASFTNTMLENGWQVWGCARSNSIENIFLPYKLSKNIFRFNFFDFNINHASDLVKLIKIIKDNNIEYIVNFIAQGMVAESWKNPKDWYNTNVLGQVCLHDELRRIKTIKKYVHVTTPEVYGSTTGWIKENFNFKPTTPYAVSRAACDMHLLSFFKAYDFPVVFTRSANVYGNGQQLYRIIPISMLSARLGEKMKLHGGGLSKRSFIHINDVSKATLKIMLNGKPGDSYHISTNELISIKDLVYKIFKLYNLDFQKYVDEDNERLGKDAVYSLDSNKLRETLDWKDKITLDQGLASTYNWVKDNLKTLKNMPREYIHKS